MEENYEKLLARISKSADVSVEELERKVAAKRSKLSGLISKEGAAQIIAAELGIVFDNELMKISELVQGMKRANIVGKIIEISPVREFNKNGREGKVVNFLLADETSNVRAILWDLNHISLIERGEIKEGDVVEIKNGNVRNEEVHLSGFSDIKKSNEKIENVKEEKIAHPVKLKSIKVGQNASIRGIVVQIFEPRYFSPKDKPGEKRALLNFVLDDGTETMRCVTFGDNIKKLGFTDEEIFSPEKFALRKEEPLGDEKVFSGLVRMNNYTQNVEMSVNEIDDIDADKLISELQTKQN